MKADDYNDSTSRNNITEAQKSKNTFFRMLKIIKILFSIRMKAIILFQHRFSEGGIRLLPRFRRMPPRRKAIRREPIIYCISLLVRHHNFRCSPHRVLQAPPSSSTNGNYDTFLVEKWTIDVCPFSLLPLLVGSIFSPKKYYPPSARQ